MNTIYLLWREVPLNEDITPIAFYSNSEDILNVMNFIKQTQDEFVKFCQASGNFIRGGCNKVNDYYGEIEADYIARMQEVDPGFSIGWQYSWSALHKGATLSQETHTSKPLTP